MSEDAPAAGVTVPAARYTDRDFARAEQHQLWRKAWVLVGGVNQVTGPGDYLEARFGVVSVMVVRGEDGRLRGFENVCQHQGSPLCNGSGTGLDQIQCRQHQWTWDLAGSLQAIDFGQKVGPEDNIPLLPVCVETWGPFVFASFDFNAGPLTDAIAPLIATIDDAGLDAEALRLSTVVSMTAQCNWKTLIDGVSAIGPQPELGAAVFPNLAVDATADGLTIVRARPGVSYDRAVLDLLTLVTDVGTDRPHEITVRPKEDLPVDLAIDPALVEFARRQTQGADLADIVADTEAAPRLAALHAALEEQLGIHP